MKIQPKSHRAGKIRKRVSSYTEKILREAIERDAIRWKCSKSWIIATALAAFYDIDIIQFNKLVEVKRKNKRAG